MADIFHDFVVQAPAVQVFETISTPAGLDCWWTQRSAGEPRLGAMYELRFGPEHSWQARISKCVAGSSFEFEMTSAHADWMGTRIGFELQDEAGKTNARFYHTGWPSQNEHWRLSCYCWAMYLRVMRRYVEHGEFVPYAQRLDV